MITPISKNVYDFNQAPRCFKEAIAHGLIKCSPEDFIVEEVLGFEPSGVGDHLWLWVESRLANTSWVITRLARVLACRKSDIGFSGMKDKHAVSRQWFSVPRPENEPDWRQLPEEIKVLNAILHERKLKRGWHRANRFEITIRQFSAETTKIDQRLLELQQQGFPNYFADQRFANRAVDLHQLSGRLAAIKSKRDMRQQQFLLSQARSILFNQVLAQRIEDASWNQVLAGDIMMFNDNNAVFHVDQVEEDLIQRADQLQIHVTGPLVGAEETKVTQAVFALEVEVLADFNELYLSLAKLKLATARRPLRAVPQQLHWKHAPDTLHLQFVLNSGTYATAFIRELGDFAVANPNSGIDD
ncbi:MAG: tRNA pseudouridine(13) synthase TruD [Gammaproteobacteria bacterium]|nr:tRNA pseudouridine(13) synthase TruD [Gammaproteobacteria bacterium]MDH5729630.1 tRNA pseudouridine(13) synthase TruD [Gammaproteobacteria bacterium]